MKAAQSQVRVEAQTPDPARPGQYLPITLQLLNVNGDLFRGTHEIAADGELAIAA